MVVMGAGTAVSDMGLSLRDDARRKGNRRMASVALLCSGLEGR